MRAPAVYFGQCVARKRNGPRGGQLPRGPERCGRISTVASLIWASTPARLIRPPFHLRGNRRGGRSLSQARQSCQEPVGSRPRSFGLAYTLFGWVIDQDGSGITRHRGNAGRPQAATGALETEVGGRIRPGLRCRVRVQFGSPAGRIWALGGGPFANVKTERLPAD